MQLIPFTTRGSRGEFPVYTGNSSRRASIKLNRCRGGMPAAVAVVRGGGSGAGNNERRQLPHKAPRAAAALAGGAGPPPPLSGASAAVFRPGSADTCHTPASKAARLAPAYAPRPVASSACEGLSNPGRGRRGK